ncbi:MAG: tryptophanase [candidate division WOR-3 bacterium]
MKHPFEPFRIKITEPIVITTRAEREAALKASRYNLFQVPSRTVLVDLLTDSGTGAMSQDQLSSMMASDEAYACPRSWERFEAAVQEFTGMPYVIPSHQGRAGERIACAALLKKGDVVLSNTLFETTRANLAYEGAVGIDIPCPESLDIFLDTPFKGNIDLDALEDHMRKGPVRAVIMTLTNNFGGGQPASWENIRGASALAKGHGALFWIDACRIAENAYFIKEREGINKTVPEIIRDIFSLADLVTLSTKKDFLTHAGGFIALRDEALARKMREIMVIWEGFPAYGGLARRELEAMVHGLTEATDEAHLRYRVNQVAYLAIGLREAGFPVLWPPGGHAAYIDASGALPHIPREEFPGHALACAFYTEGGVRGTETDSLLFRKDSPRDMFRLAVPRRVYTQSHIDHVIETGRAILSAKKDLRGYRLTYAPERLAFFLAEYEPL